MSLEELEEAGRAAQAETVELRNYIRLFSRKSKRDHWEKLQLRDKIRELECELQKREEAGCLAARRLAQRVAADQYEHRGQSSRHSWPSFPHRIMT